MREIKFRAKSSVFNDWVYGNLIIMRNKYIDGEREHKVVIPFEDICPDGHHIHYDSDRPVFVKEDTIGQYTGLKAENGVEIYEGDILRLNNKYDSYSNGGCIPDQDNICVGYVVFDDGFNGWCVHVVESDNVKVIGVGAILPIYMFDYVSGYEVGYEVIGNIYDNKELLEEEK